MSDLPALRASDADRDRMVVLLREHAAQGRLTLEEFTERMSAAYLARTSEELEELVRDLPVGHAPVTSRRRPTRFLLALLGSSEREEGYACGAESDASLGWATSISISARRPSTVTSSRSSPSAFSAQSTSMCPRASRSTYTASRSEATRARMETIRCRSPELHSYACSWFRSLPASTSGVCRSRGRRRAGAT